MTQSIRLAMGVICISLSTALIAQAPEGHNESGLLMDNRKYSAELVPRTIIGERPQLKYEPLREADVKWEKHLWREIDTREKMNLSFRYPLDPLVSIMSDEILDGSVAAFRDESFTQRMSRDEIQQLLSRIDTVRIIDPVSGLEQVQVTRSELNPNDIVKYRLKEIWYFDKEASRVNVRVMALAPVMEYYDDDTGQFKYEAPLFWIHFPNSRDVLGRHVVFNPDNDAPQLSWTDLFELRKFSSYIYKESNIHDARLKDIYPDDGIARLMEADRIESELYNWESDLWTY